jgi:hypothetical protein
MPKLIKYNTLLLQEIIKRDDCYIDIKKYIKLNSKIIIDFTCFCKKEYSKSFNSIYIYGAFCDICTNIKTQEKKKLNNLIKNGSEYVLNNRDKFNKTITTKNLRILDEIIKRDKCTLDINQFTKLNNEILVNFRCYCGNEHIKKFRTMFDHGAFCENCTNINKMKKTKETTLERYGVEHQMHSEEIKEKTKQTSLQKYGTEYPMQNKDIQEKTKQTNLERYGVEYLSQNLEIKEKIKQVNLRKIGVENQFQSNKIKETIKLTNLERYGVENPSQSEEIKKKKIATSFENYGVDYPMQNSEISEKQFKNSLRLKNFTFPDMIVIKVQGYEDIALQNLVDQGYKQNDLITSRKDVPKIWYHDLEYKKHRYYCDIYIPCENRIIEVKSTWTYEKDLHINTLKAETCKVEGYNFEFWIFDRKMKCEIKKFYTEMIIYGDSIPGYEKITVSKKEPGRSGIHFCLNICDVPINEFAESVKPNWQEYRGFKIGDTIIKNKEYKDLSGEEYYTKTHKGFQKIKKIIRHTTNKKLYKIRARDSNGKIHQVIVTEGHSLILQSKRKIAAENLMIGTWLYDYR